MASLLAMDALDFLKGPYAGVGSTYAKPNQKVAAPLIRLTETSAEHAD